MNNSFLLFVCFWTGKEKKGKEVVRSTEDSLAKNTRSKRRIRSKKIRKILDL
jgi:hypothetical protein